MRAHFTLLIYLLLSIAGFSQIEPDKNFIEKISSEESKMYTARLHAVPTQAGLNYDLKYHRLEWEIDPDTLHIQGKITSYFKTTKNNVDTIVFDMSAKLKVDSVIFHNSIVSYDILLSQLLVIHLNDTLALNKLDSVSVYYHGHPDNSTGFGAFAKGTHPDGNIIWTLSEPYGAREWWPSKQSLTDKIDSIDIFVRTPKINKVASNGVLMNETIDGNYKICYWKHRYPIATYLIAIAVTNYSEYSDYVHFKNDSLEILNYVYPSSLASAKNETKITIPIMELFDSLFVPYPFMKEKYGHAQFGWGGGMEHQTMSFMGNFGFELIAHELAHQWFGNKITCGNWKDLWLNEGFATYLTGLSYQYKNHKYWNQWKKVQIDQIVSEQDGSVYVKDTNDLATLFSGRLTYSKGAMLLHMLRWKLGDSIFFQAVKNYLNDPMLSYSFARTEHLKNHFESASGKNLTEFFSDWFYGEGFPRYQINWSQSNDNEVTLDLFQIPSHSSVSFFEMPVPVLFKNQNEDTLITVDHTFSGQQFKFNLRFHADSIILDPHRWIVMDSSLVTGIGNPEKIFAGVQIFPNPSNGSVNLVNPYFMRGEMIVYSNLGVLLKKFQVNEVDVKMDISDLPAGLYFLEFRTVSGLCRFKLLKR